ncbi:Cilia- and flagella-associated protein 44 [Quaeritorhiza haematococci]|nr:Cilia- and flagella-associated protein 44 [Quaeritorhiza haematococci]
MGHIKFWRMAATFTGLKLQGYIGKFGATELTDIVAFVQLPDGKVLSSAETGNMLLWDGGMINCEIANKGKKPCHQGRIEVVMLVEGEIFTAGEDGYIRIWDLETIENADVVTVSSGEPSTGIDKFAARIFEMEPVDEILVGKDVKVGIKAIARSAGNTVEFVIQDAGGHLFKLDIKKRSTEKVLSFHSGEIAGIDTSPFAHAMVSLGSDGTLRLYDYLSKSMIAQLKYDTCGTALSYLPLELDGRGRTFAAGFSDGVLRIFSHTPVMEGVGSGSFMLQYAFKPHKMPITAISISPDGAYLATASKDKTVFFFKINVLDRSQGSVLGPKDFDEGDSQEDIQGADEPPQPQFDPLGPEFSRKNVKIIPLGFIQLESSIVSISFSPDNHSNVDIIEPDENQAQGPEEDNGISKAGDEHKGEAPNIESNGKFTFVVLESGELMSLVVPPFGTVDTSLTFELPPEAINMERWQLDIPPPSEKDSTSSNEAATGADAAQSGKVEDGAGTKRDSTASQANKQPGKTDSKSGERQTSALRKARGLAITPESSINRVLYLEGGYFVISLTNKAGEGEIRACKYGFPQMSRLLLVHDSPFTDLRLSTSGKYLLAGARDGTCCLRKFRIEDISLFKWTIGHEDYIHYSQTFDAEKMLQLEEIEKKASGAASDSGGGFGNTFDSDMKSRSRPFMADGTMLTGGDADGGGPDVLGQYWLGHVHDNEKGRVTSVVTSFDDAFFCTAGTDGGIFLWRINIEQLRKNDDGERAFGMPVANNGENDGEVEVRTAEDVTDANAYSIQEEKIKAERDKELEEAEIKKRRTRAYIKDLREQFLQVVEENENTPEEMRVARNTLSVDPDLRTNIERNTTQQVQNVQKEMAWISEKESIGLEKLRSRFLDGIKTERISIRAFKGRDTVNAKQSAGKEETKTADQGASKVVSKKVHKALDAKSKLEARKKLRAERSLLWKELMEAKPDENYEDPRDVAAIRYAENNMGDYKLKTGEKYIVPETERVDADKKKRQILLLKESIYQFNQQVLGLRDQKRTLIDKFKKYRAVLDRINQELIFLGESVDTSTWSPVMETSAYPELRYEVTARDIKQLQKEEEEAANRVKQANADSLNMFGNGMPAGGNSSTNNGKDSAGVRGGSSRSVIGAGPSSASIQPRRAGGGSRVHAQQRGPSVEVGSATSGQNNSSVTAETTSRTASVVPETSNSRTSGNNLSELELWEQDTRRKVLKYRKQRILQAMDNAVATFDANIDKLGKERVALQADLKFADMKLLLLYKEWVLLKEFEKHDNALADKLQTKQMEKADIDSKIQECQEKLNAKKLEVEQVIRRGKEIQDEFQKALGENNKHEEYLSKIFKKKIKRSSKKKNKPEGTNEEGTNEEDDRSEDEEEDSDDDLMDSSYDSDSVATDADGTNGGGEEVCPPDCDPAVFARVLDLRERKLDQEDLLVEIQKVIETLKKENDAFIKKEKIIFAALKNTEAEIEDFQTQKQQKLNELDVVVSLRLHQLQYLEKNALPSNLSQALVFVGQTLVKLRNRIKELQQEKADIRKSHKELKKMHVSLNKNKKEKQQKLQELDERAYDVQMLKFGQVIDLERLERMGVNRNADELRERLQKEEYRHIKELEEWKVRNGIIFPANKINKLKEQLTEVTKENTVRLEQLVDFTEEQQRLEDTLNLSQASVTAEYSGPHRKELMEKERLIQLVQQQSQQIEQLKAEIDMLIRKPTKVKPMPAPVGPNPGTNKLPPTSKSGQVDIHIGHDEQ